MSEYGQGYEPQKPQKAAKHKKPITKKWWFWVIIGMFVIYIIAPKQSEEPTSSENQSQEAAVTETPTPTVAPTITDEEFCLRISDAIQDGLGESEHITDVYAENKTLNICIDLSEADPAPLTLRELAETRTSSITDIILALGLDANWNKIMIDFGAGGTILLNKAMIKENEVGRYFESLAIINNFKTDETAPKETETTSQRNAVSSAQSYLKHMSFSRKGLISQLEYEGYPAEDAQYAVDKLNVDWNEQAEKTAMSYLEHMSFSKQGLLEQLEYEGFTPEQAAHGADAAYK